MTFGDSDRSFAETERITDVLDRTVEEHMTTSRTSSGAEPVPVPASERCTNPAGLTLSPHRSLKEDP